jgi:hypothetical protein
MKYEAPVVVDYGDLLELTAAVGLFGTEDGGTKILPNHHNTSPPLVP